MKTRTKQARLCDIIIPESGDTIRVTYAPVEQVLVFNHLRSGTLPRTFPIGKVWEWVKEEAAKPKPQPIDPNQLEHPHVVETCMAQKVPNTVLPQAGVEVVQVPDVQPVQGPEVGTAESATVCVQESAEQSETTGPRVQPYVPAVSEFCQ